MTLQQLEYILAVNQFRHFAKAAEHCRVTQPTLSAMIQKLEDELDTRYSTETNNPSAHSRRTACNRASPYRIGTGRPYKGYY